MKKYIAISLLALCSASYAYKNYSPEHPNYVQGYTKQNGTYVNPYYRSSPNSGYSERAIRESNRHPNQSTIDLGEASNDFDNDDN